jgi:hypothetical protein
LKTSFSIFTRTFISNVKLVRWKSFVLTYSTKRVLNVRINLTSWYNSWNRISEAELIDLVLFPNLEILDLSNNEFETLSHAFIEALMNNSTPSKPPAILLHDNPWQCDCNLIRLIMLFNQSREYLSPGWFSMFYQHFLSLLINLIHKHLESSFVLIKRCKCKIIILEKLFLFHRQMTIPFPVARVQLSLWIKRFWKSPWIATQTCSPQRLRNLCKQTFKQFISHNRLAKSI